MDVQLHRRHHTTSTSTTPVGTRPSDEVLAAAAAGLVDLGEVVSGIAADDLAMRAGLAALVVDLEDRAAAPLGSTDGEPLIVLQRRFARAERLLARRTA